MPLYEYRCRSCEHQFETQQAFSDDPLSICPECAGELRKVFTPVGISFKGSGFYKNDSRGSTSGSGSKSSSSETSADSSGSTSGEGSSAPPTSGSEAATASASASAD